MAIPLTKRKKPDKAGELGEPYVRLPQFECQIDNVIELELEDLRTHLDVFDRKDKAYLASETLIHLIRKARREKNRPVLDASVKALFRRCEANLLKTVDNSLPNAGKIREDTLAELGKLLARDGTGKVPDRLDLFEWRFNLQFQSLRIDAIRRETSAVNRNASLPSDATAVDVADLEAAFDKVASCQTTSDARGIYAPSPEDQMMARDIYRQLCALPKDERNALIETKIIGLTEEEAGSKLGVSSRTIRTRKKNAIARLKSLKEST
ncbi:MAG: sigma factor-like helix-turn-helix DNA-binding protein [Paracoccaceae bacterium]